MDKLYLEDYSNEEKIFINEDIEENNIKIKPTINLTPDINTKGEKVVIFSINIPLKKNGLKIDILINDEMYKNIGKHLNKL